MVGPRIFRRSVSSHGTGLAAWMRSGDHVGAKRAMGGRGSFPGCTNNDFDTVVA